MLGRRAGSQGWTKQPIWPTAGGSVDSKSSRDGRGPLGSANQPPHIKEAKDSQQLVQGQKTTEWKIKGQNTSLVFQKTRKQTVSHFS